jgi:phosphoglycerate dehydrogenase-like enzyme
VRQKRLRVVVLDDYQNAARGLADWTAIGPDLDLVVLQEHIADEQSLIDALSGAEVVVAMRERTPLSRAVLEQLPELRLVITTGTRNASIDPPPHVLFCGTRSLASPTAELTWALLLAAKRRLGVELQAIKIGRWQSTIGEGIEGQTIGIIGLGAIGSRIAAVARSFGMTVLAWSANLSADDAAERGAELVSLDQLLIRSDVVSIHTRLSDRTRGLIAARELELMGPRTLLVNTSRAEIVDQDALLVALNSGTLGGVALDVYEIEPLPAEHPLRSAPRAVLTPHLGYVTRQNYELFFGDVVEDIIAYRAGAPVRQVTP